ncbi:MAG: acyl carrier protein [Lachnospiraceae bacterium]|nr:acyl carrier protein [Lachnospiraceae bacterium]
MLEKVAELIRTQLHLSETTMINEDTNFKEDLRADSFELMELIMAVEDEYGIKVEDEDLEKFETVGNVLDYIKEKGIDID